MPYLGLDENGAHSVVKRNSVMDTLVKNVIVSVNNVTNMPIVTNIDINEITARIIGTILSLYRPFCVILGNQFLTFVFEAIPYTLRFLPIIKKWIGNRFGLTLS